MTEPFFEPRQVSDKGGRFYLHPLRLDPAGQPLCYWSVTTILGLKEKEALKFWAANLAAQEVADHLPTFLRAVLVEPCGRSKCRTEPMPCQQCLPCLTHQAALRHVAVSERRKREGTAVHDLVEYWVTHDGETMPWKEMDHEEGAPHWDVLEPYWLQFLQFVADYGLTPQSWKAAELKGFNHEHVYAGTLDGVLEIAPVTLKAAKLLDRLGVAPGESALVVKDVKTREGDDKAFYSTFALQLAAYRRFETLLPKGSAQEFPMPATVGGCILQLRPGGYSFEPVLTDDATFEAFLALARHYPWEDEWGDRAVQVKALPPSPGFTWVDPGAPVAEKKAAPRKRAARKAAPAATPPPPEGGPAPRIRGAALDVLTRTGGYHEIPDEEIPF